MSDEQKENRVNIENLPQAEREVSPEEAQGVQGGSTTQSGYNTWRANFGRTSSAENEPENKLKQ